MRRRGNNKEVRHVLVDTATIMPVVGTAACRSLITMAICLVIRTVLSLTTRTSSRVLSLAAGCTHTRLDGRGGCADVVTRVTCQTEN